MNTLTEVNDLTQGAEDMASRGLWNTAAGLYQKAAEAVPKYRGSKRHVTYLERQAESCREKGIFVRCVN